MSNVFEQRFYNGQGNTSIEKCRYFGESHASYEWNRQLDPRWTDEQQKAYHEGYDMILEELKRNKN